jgi:broad specificity phosphatase PhoE
MKLTLVRHGETEENAQDILQGQIPGHLNEKGKEQAQVTAENLRHERFDAIYCSDLQRCLDTAEIIRAYHPDTPFYTEVLLRERYGGSLQGRPLAEETAMFGREEWYTHKLPGGGESWEDVRTRQVPVLNKLLEQYPDGSVLIVAHGGSVRGIRSLLEHRSLAEIDAEETPNAGVWHEDMQEPVHA